MDKINIREKFSGFSDQWAPKVIAEMNDYQFKLVKIEGEFVWHEHEETDEAFIVIEGSMSMSHCCLPQESGWLLGNYRGRRCSTPEAT